MTMPWIIAAIGWLLVIVMSAWNHRRSHYAQIVLRRPEMLTIIGDNAVEQYLRIDVFSHGADVYDLKVLLEASYPQPDQPDHLMTARLEFDPEEPLPNPLKTNQHTRFRLYREKLLRYPYNPREPSQRLELTKLRMGSVKIVAYQSGGRRITELLAGDFEQSLHHFDRAPEIRVETRGDETIATMRHPSGEVHQIITGVRRG